MPALNPSIALRTRRRATGEAIVTGSFEDEVNDLRDWLEPARAASEVRDIADAHWDREIGAASEVNCKRPSPPAPVFDDIAGYRSGLRVLTAGTANAQARHAPAAGTDLDDRALVEALPGANVAPPSAHSDSRPPPEAQSSPHRSHPDTGAVALHGDARTSTRRSQRYGAHRTGRPPRG